MKAFLLFILLYPLISFGQNNWTLFNTLNSDLSYNAITCIEESNSNKLFIGTQYGLNKFHNEVWENYNLNLGSFDVRSLAILNDSLFIGGLSTGINILNTLIPSSVYSFNTLNSNLLSDQINHIEIIHDTLFLFGTVEGLTFSNNLIDSNTWSTYNLLNQLSSNNISSIDYHKASDKIAIGTMNGGLIYMIEDTFHIFDIQNSNIPDNSITDLKFNTNGDLWAGTPSGGLIYHTSDGLFLLFNTISSTFPSNAITCLDLDSTGNIWVGTQNIGLVKFNGVSYTIFDTQNSLIPNNYINTVLVDKNQVIWIGTDFGLIRFNPNLTINSNIHKELIKIYDNYSIEISSPLVSNIALYSITGQNLREIKVFKNQILSFPKIKTGLYWLSINNNHLGVQKVFLYNKKSK